MKIDLRFAEIHAPLFLMGDKGMNLGTKLDPSKRTGLKLVYDRDAKELLVSFENMHAIVPATNVVSMIEAPAAKAAKVEPEAVRVAQKVDMPAFGTPITAQLETPQSHVHAGPGKGQTGQEMPKPLAAPKVAPKGKK